jgi:subtilisin family serine protease
MLYKNLIFVISVLLVKNIPAQMNTFEEINRISERAIFIEEKSKTRYSDMIRVKFRERILENNEEYSSRDLRGVKDESVRNYLYNIKETFGDFQIKHFLTKNNTQVQDFLNKRSHDIKFLPDWSKVYEIIFDSLVPIDSLVLELEQQSYVEYAEGPIQVSTMTSPNDEKYRMLTNWAYEAIDAEHAWDISQGSSKVVIAIHDKFGNKFHNQLHEDLLEKVDRHFNKFGNHGCSVAGIAGASTNNKIGIASLGWNIRLKFYDMTYTSMGILEAVADGVDVINFSHCTRIDFPTIRDAVKTALAAGIVLIASAGNNCFDVPDVLYPAAYNFGNLGQVIAVSATGLKNNKEVFVDGWNYSPCNNILTDTTASFIDVSAPGKNILMLDPKNPEGYRVGSGTSLSSAFVSSLAGLMLSINGNLTPKEIYEIITSTADKVGQYVYDENGWNQYLGHGRINAYKAVRKTKLTLRSKRNLLLYVNSNRLPCKFTLFQNYPNPFNPSTRIRYQLFDGSNVALEVYDLLGEKITTLIDGYKSAGVYEEVFEMQHNNRSISSGVYLFKLSVNGNVQTKKGLLLK